MLGCGGKGLIQVHNVVTGSIGTREKVNVNPEADGEKKWWWYKTKR